jgi:hypothetical protein
VPGRQRNRPWWNPWLGDERGQLTDWITQQWVRRTGTTVDFGEQSWLRGPSGRTDRISEDDFARFAAAEDLQPLPPDADAGLLAGLEALRGPDFDPDALQDQVADFYLRTARYRLHLWSQWSPRFRPLGRAVDFLFAQRLRQLQLPLAPLDGTEGVTSRVLRFGPAGRTATHVAWLRTMRTSGDVLYAGMYSVATPPLADGPCVKVAFPLPNGNASVFLEPRVAPDGSLVLLSEGRAFGGPGFYFTLGSGRARVVPQLHERIHVYVDEEGELHTDHVFWIWRRVFLRLHYRLRRVDES